MKRYKKEILRVGKWVHPSAPNGVLEVTKDYLKTLVENFKKTPFVPVLRGHVSNIEAEKNPTLILNKNINKLMLSGDKLFAEMELEEKELEKYNDVSVSIEPDYIDKESGKNIGAVLRHVAAVVNPYIKGMEGFTMLSENDKNILINLSEIQDMTKQNDPIIQEVELEETAVEETVEETEEIEVEKVEENISEDSKTEEVVIETEVEPKKEADEAVEDETKEELEEEKVETSEDVATQLKETQIQLAEAKLLLAKKEADEKYNTLLSEGRILPSQKEAFIALSENAKGEINLSNESINLGDLLYKLFKANPVLVNLEEQGAVKETTEVEVDAEPSEEEVIKAEIKALPVHAKKSEEEFAKYWSQFGKAIVADYTSAKK